MLLQDTRGFYDFFPKYLSMVSYVAVPRNGKTETQTQAEQVVSLWGLRGNDGLSVISR